MTTELCPDCGRPRYDQGYGGTATQCFALSYDFGGLMLCRESTIARLRAELAEVKELSASLRKFRTPRATVGPFANSQLKSRPILLETDDAALQQLRDLVNALGNWYDFSAFNEVVLASARELSEALGWVLDRSPHVGITAPGGHVNCWTAQMDCGREKVYADGATMVDALLALRAKKAGV